MGSHDVLVLRKIREHANERPSGTGVKETIGFINKYRLRIVGAGGCRDVEDCKDLTNTCSTLVEGKRKVVSFSMQGNLPNPNFTVSTAHRLDGYTLYYRKDFLNESLVPIEAGLNRRQLRQYFGEIVRVCSKPGPRP
jgi:hypothetical protein